MSEDPDPAEPLPGPDDALWQALEALAAGETPEAEREALEERLRADPALAACHERALRVERALAGEGLLPLPGGLERRIVESLPQPLALPGLATWARLAAAVLVAFLAWAALEGGLPQPAAAAPFPPAASAFLPVWEAGRDVAARAPGLAPAPLAAPGPLALAGAALLAGGLAWARALARRWAAEGDEA
jgi:hypothetical protein